MIKNTIIINDTKKPRCLSDIGISNEKITKIGKINKSEGRTIIDATGLIVFPGFIDMHSHTDLSILFCPKAFDKINQGVTT